MSEQVTHADVIRAMEIFGGGFVQALAEAWCRADKTNAAKLLAAFPEYYSQYATMAMDYKIWKGSEGATQSGLLGFLKTRK